MFKILCLSPEEHRLYAWTITYNIWIKWDFDIENEKNLFNISQSAIDFAIVGYLVEIAPSYITEHTKNLIDSLNIVSNEWYESQSTQIGAINRALSYFQPMAHANKVMEEGFDWYYPPGHTYKINFTHESLDYLQIIGLA